jgi:hypothetical protein
MAMRNLLGLTVLGVVLSAAGAGQAAPLFTASGRVDFGNLPVPSGVTVRLEVDLDRNGQFSKFERLTGTVDGSGNYQLTYALDPADLSLEDLKFAAFVTGLVADYSARGFDALLDQGPVPVVLTFEREGYSTVVRRLNTMLDSPTLDIDMTPLQAVGCTLTGCQSARGNLVVSGFPGGTGISRAYAEAYDPAQDTSRFPGGFVERGGDLLISSGFMEVDFRDQNGNRVSNVSSPVAVRFEANQASWSTLRDLTPGTDRIEVPMWSFDAVNAQWVGEANGELLDGAGARIPESALPDIQSGAHSGQVFVGFSTRHFSSWNCDRPIKTHTCVKGRLVAEADGSRVAGANVSVHGISYTGASSSVTTGADGYFVADIMKSEEPGEDLDQDGIAGESFQVRVVAGGALGFYLGPAFDTSSANKLIASSGSVQCRPADCDCPDLGDVVVKFEPPRLCEVTVHAVYSGQDLTGKGDGPLSAGAAVVQAEVSGKASGEVEVPQAAAAAACAGKVCSGTSSDTQGNATFLVPVAGASPLITISSEVLVTQGTQSHFYAARKQVTGCTASDSRLSATVELEYSHASLSGVAAFIAALGPGPTTTNPSNPTSPTLPATPEEIKNPAGCLCKSAPRPSGGGLAPLLLGSMLVLLRARRRASQPSR